MRIINIILGLGTAIILSLLIVLGIRAFYPAPTPPDYNIYVRPMPLTAMPACNKADAQCLAQQQNYLNEQQKEQELFQTKQTEYESQLKIYNRNVFIIANISGLAVFAGGLWGLLAVAAVGDGIFVGAMFAGLFGIFYGYIVGWNSAGDKLKFFVGLAVAALIIGGSSLLVQRRYSQNK